MLVVRSCVVELRAQPRNLRCFSARLLVSIAIGIALAFENILQNKQSCFMERRRQHSAVIAFMRKLAHQRLRVGFINYISSETLRVCGQETAAGVFSIIHAA